MILNCNYSLFMCQDKDENETKNESFCSFYIMPVTNEPSPQYYITYDFGLVRHPFPFLFAHFRPYLAKKWTYFHQILKYMQQSSIKVISVVFYKPLPRSEIRGKNQNFDKNQVTEVVRNWNIILKKIQSPPIVTSLLSVQFSIQWYHNGYLRAVIRFRPLTVGYQGNPIFWWIHQSPFFWNLWGKYVWP